MIIESLLLETLIEKLEGLMLVEVNRNFFDPEETNHVPRA